MADRLSAHSSARPHPEIAIAAQEQNSHIMSCLLMSPVTETHVFYEPQASSLDIIQESLPLSVCLPHSLLLSRSPGAAGPQPGSPLPISERVPCQTLPRVHRRHGSPPPQPHGCSGKNSHSASHSLLTRMRCGIRIRIWIRIRIRIPTS